MEARGWCYAATLMTWADPLDLALAIGPT
jgi:hypothetical protein